MHPLFYFYTLVFALFIRHNISNAIVTNILQTIEKVGVFAI